MVEQAVKTKALVSLYYGKAPKYTYYDGHSQGGRQGMKLAQEYPELYDGYMIAQPALSIAKFGTAGLYPQIVMKPNSASPRRTSEAEPSPQNRRANKRAVAACDKADWFSARSLCLRLQSCARRRGAMRRRSGEGVTEIMPMSRPA